MKKVFKVKEKDSILQEYEEIRKELGKAKYEALNKYLATHKNILLSDVYYNENEWNKFDAWFRNGMKDCESTAVVDSSNYVIYKSGSDIMGTNEDNYNTRIQNAREIQNFTRQGFSNVQEVVEYVKKYFKVPGKIIVKDGGITERLEEANEIIKENLEDADEYVIKDKDKYIYDFEWVNDGRVYNYFVTNNSSKADRFTLNEAKSIVEGLNRVEKNNNRTPNYSIIKCSKIADSLGEQEALAQIVKADKRFSDPRTQIKYVGKAKTTTGKEMDKYVVGIKGGPIQYNAYFWENGKLNYISSAPKGTVNDKAIKDNYVGKKVEYNDRFQGLLKGKIIEMLGPNRARVEWISGDRDNMELSELKIIDKCVRDNDPTYRSVWMKVKEYVKNHYNFNYKNDFRGLMDFLNNQYGGSIDEDKVYDILRDLNGKGYIVFVKDSKLKEEIKNTDKAPNSSMVNELKRKVEEFKRRGYDEEDLKITVDGNKVWFTGELSYSTHEKLANELDKIIAKYDKDAYFDAETSGRWVAHFFDNKTTDAKTFRNQKEFEEYAIKNFGKGQVHQNESDVTGDSYIYVTPKGTIYYTIKENGTIETDIKDSKLKDDEIYHITKEQWNKIPNAYKGKTPDGKRTVFAAFVYPNGGTTLLTEGAHFVIDGKSKMKDYQSYVGFAGAEKLKQDIKNYNGNPAVFSYFLKPKQASSIELMGAIINKQEFFLTMVMKTATYKGDLDGAKKDALRAVDEITKTWKSLSYEDSAIKDGKYVVNNMNDLKRLFTNFPKGDVDISYGRSGFYYHIRPKADGKVSLGSAGYDGTFNTLKEALEWVAYDFRDLILNVNPDGSDRDSAIKDNKTYKVTHKDKSYKVKAKSKRDAALIVARKVK